jgi:hypothetical protein
VCSPTAHAHGSTPLFNLQVRNQMLWHIPDKKLGHIPFENFNECCNLAGSFLYLFNAAVVMRQHGKKGGSLLIAQ